MKAIEEKEWIFFIKIKSPDSSLLIWNKGQTLSDLKRILSLLLSHKLETKILARIEVNNYLEEKDRKLFSFIDEKIELCKKLWKDIKLPFFSSYERKKIHNYISEKNLKTISTKSEGEGKDRRLYICKEYEKMSIDIDGVEI
jgi:predicted RNA-binding protein Jag